MTNPDNIRLHPMTFNPFSLNGFDKIWGERSDAVREDCQYTIEHPNDINNKKFFIVDGRMYPIGITGYYLIDGRLILSWHGVIPSSQNKGASTIALRILAQHLYCTFDHITDLIELVPEDREEELGPYFTSLGFVTTGKIFSHPDFLDSVVWKEYHVNIERLADL